MASFLLCYLDSTAARRKHKRPVPYCRGHDGGGVGDPVLRVRDGFGWRCAAAMLMYAAMELADRKMVVVARLRAAPLVAWHAVCLGLLAVLLRELAWGGDPLDALWNMLFGQPMVVMGIAALLTVWAYWLGVWRRRKAYVRHDGRMLYRGSAAAWPLVAIRDVMIVRGELGVKALRLVVDDDSEVTRELVKLYLLEDRPEVVRDAVMFAVARAGGVGVSGAVH